MREAENEGPRIMYSSKCLRHNQNLQDVLVNDWTRYLTCSTRFRFQGLGHDYSFHPTRVRCCENESAIIQSFGGVEHGGVRSDGRLRYESGVRPFRVQASTRWEPA
jgi:hypothetical protein